MPETTKTNPIVHTLLKEKEKDYVRLLIFLLLFVFYTLLFIPTLHAVNFNQADLLLQVGSLGLGVWIIYLVFRMIRNFVQSKLLIVSLFVFMGFGIIMGSIANNPVFPLDHNSWVYVISLSFSFAGGVVGMLVCLYFMILDIFAESHSINYRLWGAAVIYLMIVLLFTAILGFLQIYIRDGLGEPMDVNVFSYIACFKFSFYGMAGIDLPYPDADELFTNIVAVQGFISNLYIVLLVGRVLSK
jgi:hypothetical protein